MITWKLTSNIKACIFKTKRDFILTGRSFRARGEDLPLLDSEYADDTAIIFNSRDDLTNGVCSIIAHFASFGMEVHSGKIEPKEDSKSEILFCPKPKQLYINPETYDETDLSDVNIGNNRCIPIAAEFPYLGSIVNRECTDENDVHSRIEKAGKAFGALRKCLFSSTQIKPEVKGLVYRIFILTVLLYGAECWCLTEVLFNKLRSFHRRCLRAMCRINRWHAYQHRISTRDLMTRLNVESIDTYITRQQLRWAGHVARMPWDRLPRKMLSCWVRSKRPRGAPSFTYGRGLNKALRKANINPNSWHIIAQDKVEWRKMIRNISL